MILLQIDFPHQGPFGEEMATMMRDLAKDIATEKGLVFKLWTENEATKEAGGIYLFETLTEAQNYLDKHINRLESFGYSNIRCKTFTVNEDLSVLTKAAFLEK